MFWRISVLFLITAFGWTYASDLKCHDTCKTCILYNNTNGCDSCNSDMLLVLVNDDYGYCSSKNCSDEKGLSYTDPETNIKKCYIGGRCPPKFYKNGTECKACNKSCEECSGATNNTCLSCPNGSVLVLSSDAWVGECLVANETDCEADEYVCKGSTTNCNENCEECVGNLPSHCTKCKNANHIHGIGNKVGNVGWGPCVDSVTLNRVHYSFGINPSQAGDQYKCHWTCRTCVAENDRFACTSCSDAAFLNVISELDGAPIGNCRPGCGSDGELSLTIGTRKMCSSTGVCPLNDTGRIFAVNGTCIIRDSNTTCNTSCGLCAEDKNDDCIFCGKWDEWLNTNPSAEKVCSSFKSGQVFNAYGMLRTFSYCPSPYETIENTMCGIKSCTDCLSCGSNTNACWECKNGTYLLTNNTSNIEGTCVKECDEGQFAISNRRCIKCHDSCSKCAEGLAIEKCTECPEGKVLAKTPPAPCLASCPLGSINRDGTCEASSSSVTRTSGRPAWYITAIVLGIVAMLAFFGFLTYMFLDWKDDGSSPESQANPPSKPEGEAKDEAAEERKDNTN